MSNVLKKESVESTHLQIPFNHSKLLEEFGRKIIDLGADQTNCKEQLVALQDILSVYEDIWLGHVLESLASVTNPFFLDCRTIAHNILNNEAYMKDFLSAVQFKEEKRE